VKYLCGSVDPRAWGSSDFDIRQSLNGSVIAALPSPHNGIAAVLFRNWTANSIFFARSALPTDLYIGSPYVRPDVVPGEPLYLYGPEYPGGKSFNFAAFAPPAGAQGDLGRNVMRGLAAWQIDFALHREFPLSERVSLQFRAEAFNVLNHPNFANPNSGDDPNVLTLAEGSSPAAPQGTRETLANGLGPYRSSGTAKSTVPDWRAAHHANRPPASLLKSARASCLLARRDRADSGCLYGKNNLAIPRRDVQPVQTSELRQPQRVWRSFASDADPDLKLWCRESNARNGTEFNRCARSVESAVPRSADYVRCSLRVTLVFEKPHPTRALNRFL
jgi:hypothetical protein